MGGGNRAVAVARVRSVGLSPRGRGKPCFSRSIDTMSGSIPAWAGETCCDSPPDRTAAVYPRVGGGNEPFRRYAYSNGGLSPRGRGKRLPAPLLSDGRRSIPAWAGETGGLYFEPGNWAVYPRVGGGNSGAGLTWRAGGGLSPRGRGKPATLTLQINGCRSIPAWAGETCTSARLARKLGVYPRVGGGNLRLPALSITFGGLSPRGRGKHGRQDALTGIMRSIPAWAGETGRRGRTEIRHQVYPRVGGGNIDRHVLAARAYGLSPRGRGKRSSA